MTISLCQALKVKQVMAYLKVKQMDQSLGETTLSVSNGKKKLATKPLFINICVVSTLEMVK